MSTEVSNAYKLVDTMNPN